MLFLAEIPFPKIDPVAFSLGPVAIRWYGIAYVVAFVSAHALLRRLSRERIFPAPEASVGDLIFYAMIGTIAGGRLGYVLFYKPSHYLTHPVEILQIWHGGLSFHGGILGVFLAIIVFSRKQGISLGRVMDACSCAATPGIFCVRLANFVNAELWGRPTDLPWAMVFPDPEAGPAPRHPSQLYEAVLEGALLFFLLWSVRHRPAFARPGRLAALFVGGYGTVRFVAEFAREPDRFLGFVLGPFSLGQILCTVMILIGVWGWRRSGRGTDQDPAAAPPAPPGAGPAGA